jgi:NAD-dependent SIR2 family protein deacetylase
MPETVFLLGAGFSRAAGGPLQSEMLDAASKPNREAVGHLVDTREFRTLMALRDRLPESERTIEGLLTVLDSGKLFGDQYGRFGSESLILFLLKYIETLLQGRIHDPRRIATYRAFAEQHLLNRDFAIVTFNYDLIAEQLVAQKFGGFHYGFPSADDGFRYFKLRGARNGPPLLKLHGSLSWAYCSNCRKVWWNEGYFRVEKRYLCPRNPDCNGRLRTLIVPPMWNKEAAARQLSIAWSRALEELLNAERIVVIGFSFPPLDRAALDLARSALRRNTSLKLEVFNGPKYDYHDLEARLGHKILVAGGRFEDYVSA